MKTDLVGLARMLLRAVELEEWRVRFWDRPWMITPGQVRILMRERLIPQDEGVAWFVREMS